MKKKTILLFTLISFRLESKKTLRHIFTHFLRPQVLLHFHSSDYFFFFLLSSMRKNTAICVTHGLILASACDLHPQGGRVEEEE